MLALLILLFQCTVSFICRMFAFPLSALMLLIVMYNYV